MKNKLIILLCLVIFAIAAFSSCDTSTPDADGKEQGGNQQAGVNEQGGNDSSDDGCQHPVSAEWSTNDTHHWHAATCEHGEQRGDYGEHVDVDEDGLCDDCAFEVGHDHIYDLEWTYDLERHWHTAMCSHKDENADFGYHIDDNTDGKCDNCGAHVHVVDSASGKCSICDVQVKPVDNSNLSSVISAVYSAANKISDGKIVYDFLGRSSGGQYSKAHKVIEYTLGVDCIYSKVTSASDVSGVDDSGNSYTAKETDTIERWGERLANGKVFGAYRESYIRPVDGVLTNVVGDVRVDASANEKTMMGYYYAVSTFANGYGAEEILSVLYSRALEESASDLVVLYNEGSNTYKFSYNSTIVNSTNTTVGVVNNVNYFEVSVEFTYDENYALTDLSIICDCYTNDAGGTGSGEDIVPDTANIDFTYDAATGEIAMKPTALPDTYTFTVTQTVGERTYENEYPKSYFTPDGFDVYTDGTFTTLAAPEFSVATSSLIMLYLKESGENGNDFSSVMAEDFTFTCVTTDGSVVAESWYNPITSRVMFKPTVPGKYVITISYEGVTKTFNVTVK